MCIYEFTGEWVSTYKFRFLQKPEKGWRSPGFKAVSGCEPSIHAKNQIPVLWKRVCILLTDELSLQPLLEIFKCGEQIKGKTEKELYMAKIYSWLM